MASVATVIPPKIHSESTYTFASLPRALVLQRRRLRDYSKGDDGTNRQGGSISTRRLGHGRCIPFTAWTTTISPEITEFKEPTPPTKLTFSRPPDNYRRARTCSSKGATTGRRHLEVQTEVYLEELTDTVEEANATCQTDELLERPPPVIFVPTKTGTDASTQVEDDELFDFDMESQPILEVLVGRTVQHSLIEVLQEEDIADIKRQRRRFQQLRKAYLAGEEWLKEQEKKLLDGYGGQRTNGKLLDGHVLNTLHLMHAWGYVSDPVEKDLERAFLPWVLDEVEGELNQGTINGPKQKDYYSTIQHIATYIEDIEKKQLIRKELCWFLLRESSTDKENNEIVMTAKKTSSPDEIIHYNHYH